MRYTLLAKRSLLEEMESRRLIASGVEETGLTGFEVNRDLVTDNDIPAEAFEKADVLLGFNDEKESLWYQHDEFDDVIRKVAAREGAQLRIVLPRPKPWVRTVLAKRRMNHESGTESGLKQAKIAVQWEIEKALVGIRAKLREGLNKDRWELRWIDQPTFFSYARFDDRATVLLGKRAGGKKVGGGQKTPKLTLRRLPHLPAVGSRSPRDLFEFFEREFDLLFDRGEVPPEP